MIPFVIDDGGRAEAGYEGSTGDCVWRAIAIASGLSYGIEECDADNCEIWLADEGRCENDKRERAA